MPSLPLQPAPVSASCPVRLRAQYRSGLRAGPGGALPGLGFPARNGSPRSPFGALTGRPRPGRGGVDPWVRSHARDGLRAPTPCPRPGIWAPPGPESGAGSLSSAPTSPAPLPRPAEVTRPSQALTHCRAAGCRAVPGRVWNSSRPLLCPCHRHSQPVWSWANHFLSQPQSSHPVKGLKSSPLGNMD